MTKEAFRFEQGPLPGDAALFSEDGRYRYLLERGTGKPTLGVVMMNPSIANAHHDDPTVRKVLGFARRWHFPRVRIVNPYGFIATNPKELKWAEDPIGSRNDDTIVSVMDDANLMIAAWGATDRSDKLKGRRVDKVIEYAEKMRIELWCFRETSKGAPEHPLYVPYALEPVRWNRCPMLGTRN